MPKFLVQYARVVIMETEVEADCEKEVRDENLPGVYEGLAAELIPDQVREIRDEEFIWTVEPI